VGENFEAPRVNFQKVERTSGGRAHQGTAGRYTACSEDAGPAEGPGCVRPVQLYVWVSLSFGEPSGSDRPCRAVARGRTLPRPRACAWATQAELGGCSGALQKHAGMST
jgi:hypothetical protein